MERWYNGAQEWNTELRVGTPLGVEQVQGRALPTRGVGKNLNASVHVYILVISVCHSRDDTIMFCVCH